MAYRSDSPAHHEELLEAVLKLLSEDGFSVPASVTHLDLRKLLLSGMPVDLPDNRQMVLLTVQPGCLCVGKTVPSIFSLEPQDEVEVIAGFRKGHMLLPHANQELQAGDRLLAIVTPTGRDELIRQISTPAEDQLRREISV